MVCWCITASGGGELVRTIDKKNLNLWLFVSGRFESLLGWAALMVALPLYILDLTGSGTMMGVFVLVGNLPRFFILPFAGVIGDRFNRKHLMVYLDLTKATALIFAYLFAIANKLTLPVLLGFYGVFGVINALFDAPTSAMFADLVEAQKLRQAMSLNSAATSIAQMIGPVVGGLLYGSVGMRNVLLFTALFYLLSALSEVFIRYEHKRKDSTIKVFKEIADGVRFLFGHRGLRFLFSFAALLNFIGAPLFGVVFPYIFRQELRFPAQAFGLIETVFMVGTLVGSVLVGTVLSKWSSKRLVVLGLIFQSFIGCLMSVVLWQVRSSGMALIAVVSYIPLFLIGVLNMAINIPIGANLQMLVPSEIRSRVLSILSLVSNGLTPIGSVIAGVLIDRMNSFFFFFVLSLILFVISMAFVFIAPKEAFLSPESSSVSN